MNSVLDKGRSYVSRTYLEVDPAVVRSVIEQLSSDAAGLGAKGFECTSLRQYLMRDGGM